LTVNHETKSLKWLKKPRGGEDDRVEVTQLGRNWGIEVSKAGGGKVHEIW